MKFTKIMIFILMFTLFASFANADLSNDTAGYWKFDVDSSNQVDELDNNNGTVTGATFTSAGNINGGYSFDGTGDFITYPSGDTELNIVTNLSFSFWINGTTDGSVVMGFGSGANGYVVAVGLVAAHKLNILVDGTWYNSNTNIDDGNWNLVGVSIVGTNLTFYFNGVVDGTVITGGLNSYTGNRKFGASESGGTEYTGKLDDLSIWDRALNGTEWSELYNSGDGIQYPFSLDIPPTITQSTYNVTSAYQNNTIWRTNTSLQCFTQDTTSTVTFNTDISSNCSISLNDFNYTANLVNDSNTDCSTSETTSHTCTLPSTQALSAGDNLIYIGCISTGTSMENATSTSGALNISMDFSIVGTVKDDSAAAINGAFVEAINQVTNVSVGNAISNSTGDWNIFVMPGTYTIYGFSNLNSSLNGDIKSHVVVS